MMRWIELSDTALRYELSGGGSPVLVLVHEMGGSLNSWDAVMPSLARGRRVLRYDARGAGMSAKPRGAISIDDAAGDIVALLDAEGITAAVAVAGCALGGAVAIRFAAHHPTRCAALIAMTPVTELAPERREAMRAHADRMEREGLRPLVEASVANSYPAELRTDQAAYAAFRARWLGNDPAAFAATYRMLIDLDMAADFPRVACPTLVIAAERDRLRPPAMVEPIARAIPGARLQRLDTGHFMATQTPAIVAEAMTGFLGEHEL
jgi:pimeloyl-ACP methyl ester carboxylesterase